MRRRPNCQKIIMIAYFAYSVFQYGCLAPRRWKKKKLRKTRTAQQRELSARCAPQRASMLICRFGGPKSAMISLCGELAITSHPHLQLQKMERAAQPPSLALLCSQ